MKTATPKIYTLAQIQKQTKESKAEETDGEYAILFNGIKRIKFAYKSSMGGNRKNGNNIATQLSVLAGERIESGKALKA